MASASFVPLLIGIVLIVWGTRLFERARRRIAQRPNKQTQALVSKVFAAPPAKAK